MNDDRPIEEVLSELAAAVPEAEWDKVSSIPAEEQLAALQAAVRELRKVIIKQLVAGPQLNDSGIIARKQGIRWALSCIESLCRENGIETETHDGG